tara:strand:+ start:2043 stop:2555 length:513 start_codon:yes stop_codon:yes gene_type:complete
MPNKTKRRISKKFKKSISKKSKRGGTKVKVEAFNRNFDRDPKTPILSKLPTPKYEIRAFNHNEQYQKKHFNVKPNYKQDDLVDKVSVEKDFDSFMIKIGKNQKEKHRGGSDLPEGFDKEFKLLHEKYKQRRQQQQQQKLDESFKKDEKLKEDEYTKIKIDSFNKRLQSEL